MRINLKCSYFLSRSLGLLFFFFQSLTITVLQQIGKVHDHQDRVLLCTFIRTLSYFPHYVLQHAPDYFRIFSGLFENIPEMFNDIPRNITFLSIPRVPRIMFPVPVFLVLYIAHGILHFRDNVHLSKYYPVKVLRYFRLQ